MPGELHNVVGGIETDGDLCTVACTYGPCGFSTKCNRDDTNVVCDTDQTCDNTCINTQVYGCRWTEDEACTILDKCGQ